ncbi:MAG: T9SS type A sorting domain-containing protein [Bacteroidales bacterium]|nr:T9SS type A sorting domain-containing protein [Bacteroidales bacterium]
MKKTSLLLALLAFALGLSAQTTATCDFNNYTENAPLNEQHGWVARAHSAGGGQLKTEYLGAGGYTTPDETMGAFFDNANTNFGEVATHKSTDEFPFDFSTGGTIEVEIDLLRNWWGTCFGIGYDADGDGVVLPPMTYEATCPNPALPTQDGGIYFVTSGNDPRPSFVNGIVLPDNTMPVDFDYESTGGPWTRWKIMIDLEANGGQGSVTLFADHGCTGEFEPIPEIQGVNAGLTPGSGDRFDPAMWDGVFFLSSSHGGFDNVVVRHTPAGLASQFIEFDAIPDKLTFDAPFTISATATSGLPVTFEIVEGPATLSGNIITLTGIDGIVKVRATQPGDGTQWQAAPAVNRTFEVVDSDKFTPEITIRRPYDNLNVYMSDLKPTMLVLSAYVEHGNVIKFEDVHCDVDGQTVQLQTAYPDDPSNGYWYALWEPTAFGDFDLTVSITQSGDKTTTASNHFTVTNDFNNVDAVAMNGDLTVTPANQYAYGEYALPSHVGAFATINAHYDHRCVNGENGCDPYDRIGYVRVKNFRGEWVELFRYCAPFGVECDADLDVTDYSSILQGLVEFEVYYQTWDGNGYCPILTFNMQKGTPEYLYSDVQPIWFGAYDFGDYLNPQPVPEMDFQFAEGTEEAHLKVITTGHNWSSSMSGGQAYNTGNAAEFYEATHHVLVNGQNRFDQHLWQTCTPNPDGCQPQNGTWTYNRSGWCPGSIGMVWDYDLNDYLNDGGAHLFYQFDPTYIDQCHPNYPDCYDGQNSCPHCSDPDNPILRVSGMVVSRSNNEGTLVGIKEHPDFEKDPFTVTISPNPVKHQMTIATDYELGRMSVHIYNAQGVEVRGFVMDQQATIDVSDLPAGMYFVSVIGGKVVTKKVIVE